MANLIHSNQILYPLSGSFSGSLQGTASNAVSSSFASTASYAPLYLLTSTTASMLSPYVLTSQTSSMTVATASYVQTAQTASYVLNAISSSYAATASYYSGSVSNATSASYAISSSYSATSSYAGSSSFATSASYSSTASYVLNAVSASYASTASYYGGSVTSASYATTASYAPLYVLTSTTASMLSPYVLSSNTSSFITTAQTSSMSVASASYASTASYVQQAQTASYVLNAISSSYSATASYVVSASYALSSSQAATASYYGGSVVSSSYAQTASLAPLYMLTSITSSMLQPYVLTSTTSSMTVATASYVSGAVHNSANPALSASYALTASYALNGGGATFPYSGSAVITGSLLITGSGVTITGSLNVLGSTTQVGSNNLYGNTTLSGSIIISGSTTSPTTPSIKVYGDMETNGVLKFMPVVKNIDTSISASYIYVSGSTNDLYFSQNGSGYNNTTRLRWIEGNLYSGLLNGGLITTQSATVYQVASGSGIIVNLNASLTNNPFPTVQYLNWSNLSSSIAPLSASYDQTFIAINSSGQINSSGTPYYDGQIDTLIPLGIVLHQNHSTINGVKTQPSLAYGWKQRSNIFVTAFGPLKLSGHILAVSGSSTGSIIVTGGTSFADGANYQTDPNNPAYVTDNGTSVSKIYRYYQSGSGNNNWVYNTNNGAGYGTIDPTQYSNNGVLTAVPGGGANRQWSIQRVFWYPNSVTKAIVVYYGNATYTTQADAIANINIESFVEAPNTAANGIYVGALIVRNNANFTDSTSYSIVPGGLFRQVGGSGGGGSVITQRLDGLSDVNVTEGSGIDKYALVYDNSTAKWIASNNLGVSITGNAVTATTSSYAATASYYGGSVTSASYAATASYAPLYVLTSTTSSLATTGSNTFIGNQTITGSLSVSGSHTLIGTKTLTGSLSTSGSVTVVGNETISGSLFLANQATQGSLLFMSGSGQVNNTNTGNLFWDSINNALNIGTSTPQSSYLLNVNGSTYINGNITLGNSNFTLYGQYSNYSLGLGGGQISINTAAGGGIYFCQGGAANQYAGMFPSRRWWFSSGTGYIDDGVNQLQVSGSGKFTNNLVVTGSLNVLGGITGSLSGSATSATSASYATTASYVQTAQTASYVLNAVSSSYALTASYAMNGGGGNGFPYNGTSVPAVISGSLLITGSGLTVTGSVNIGPSTITTATVTSTVGSNTVFTQVTGSYTSAFYKYTFTSQSNARAGEVMAIWNGTSVQFTDNSTPDIGNTAAVTSSVSISGANVVLSTYTPTAGWAIKSQVTYI